MGLVSIIIPPRLTEEYVHSKKAKISHTPTEESVTKPGTTPVIETILFNISGPSSPNTDTQEPVPLLSFGVSPEAGGVEEEVEEGSDVDAADLVFDLGM